MPVDEEYKKKLNKIQEGFKGTSSSPVKKALDWLKGSGPEEEKEEKEEEEKEVIPLSPSKKRFNSKLKGIKKGFTGESD